IARRTSTAWLIMEKPVTRASPEEGANSVVSILIVVVLPAPLEPSKPKTSPALTERVRASTAVNAPKRRVRALISRTMSLIENRRGRGERLKAGSKISGSQLHRRHLAGRGSFQVGQTANVRSGYRVQSLRSGRQPPATYFITSEGAI